MTEDELQEFTSEIQERSFTIECRNDEAEDSRTVDVAFSSEAPYMRWFGEEVLDHSPGSVRLERMNGAAPVLVNHDPDDQVGVVEEGTARIDGDRRGRASIRFSRSSRGEEILQDVRDKIRQLVSVRYKIHGYDVTEREGQPDLVRVTDWEPVEASIVAIPADATVGVGRSDTPLSEQRPKEDIMPEETTTVEATETQRSEAPAPAPKGPSQQEILTSERQRVRSIKEMADLHKIEDEAQRAIEEGTAVNDFYKEVLEIVGKRNQNARVESEHDGEVDLSPKDRQKFSLLRLMDALANPKDRAAQNRAGHELEVSAAAQREFGSNFQCRGEFIPTSLLEGDDVRRHGFSRDEAARSGVTFADMLRTLSVGVPTAGGNLVATNLLAADYIEILRNASALAQAGVTILDGLVGNVDITRQTSAAASTWISAEDADATESEPAFDLVQLTPKDLACYTEATRRLLQQSTPSIEGIIRMDLAIAQALGIDQAGLYGSGAAGQPRGVASQPGINTVDFAADDPTYVEIVQMIKEVMKDNALLGSLRWLIEAEGWEALSTTPKQATGAEGNFILGDNDRIKGYPYTNSNQVTAEQYFFGNWMDLLQGEWGGLEMNVDPYTHSLKGRIRYVTFKTVDLAVRHPESFCHGSNFTP